MIKSKKIITILTITIIIFLYQLFNKNNYGETFIGNYIKTLQKHATETQHTISENKLKKISHNTIAKAGLQGGKGIQGSQGIYGPPGNKGSIYQFKGPLRNLGTNKFLDRQFWDGDGDANAFVNDANYQPSQYWRLDEDYKLRNQYGAWEQCLTTDGERIYIDNCNNNKSNWKFNKYGMLKSNDKCLGTQTDSRGNIKLEMRSCDTLNYPDNQIWSFY